jgi:hypothetical protein
MTTKRGNYGEPIEEPKPEHESAAERDHRMEGWYTKPLGDADLSIAAIVGRDLANLAVAYRAWRSSNGGGSLDEGLRRFEVVHFGAQLYPMPHGILLFAITHGATSEPRRPQLRGPERQRRLDEAAGRKAREMAWPKGDPDVAKLTDERNADLQRQRRELLGEVPEKPSLADA